MSTPPSLLNDDQTASMATLFMMSHHAFRRDLARFRDALGLLVQGKARDFESLQQEWTYYVAALHGHHQMEDSNIFPSIAERDADARALIAQLSADHARIDPLLDRGTAAFARLPDASEALAIVEELRGLLSPHLEAEERGIIPFLREAKTFPAPADEALLDLYAQGFAWSLHGIAEDVVEQVSVLLPAELTARLPAARAAFTERCTRVWGSVRAGAARTPIPDELAGS